MRHKYGFHIDRSDEDVLDAIRRIKPKIVKALDPNVDFCKKVRDIVPDVFLIGRLVFDTHEQERFALAPAETGRKLAERLLRHEASKAQHQGRLLLDAWESYNEVIFGHSSTDMQQRYDDFQVAFAQPIKQAGFEPIGMNLATGNGTGADFINNFAGTMETHRYLGFHEYDWPTMWRLHDDNILEKDEEGMWLCLRYRRIMSEVRQRYGNRHTVIITECGMTQGANGGEDVGWLHEPRVSEDSYWDSLMWYNRELMRDDYVMGATLYMVGARGLWQSFEILGGLIDRLERFQNSQVQIAAIHQSPTPKGSKKVLAAPAGPPLHVQLLALGKQRQVMHFNPEAALQKRIFADGFVPNSEEFSLTHDGQRYVAQQAEHLGSGAVRVYYVLEGDWGNVRAVKRGATGAAGALAQALLHEGQGRQVIHFNAAAALQKRIFADGFVPNSEEFPVSSGGKNYAAQQAEHLGSGAVRVYYAPEGDWGNVQFVAAT